MNYDDIYSSNHIQDVASENNELSQFMVTCMSKGIDFNPSYKDSTNEKGFPYVSLMFNEKNLELIYAIVALLRLEGYEFSFEKLNEKESAFSITDVINPKENTELFGKLNDLVSNYDVAKNYYYDLSEDLQKYFDICSFAHGDKKAAVSNSRNNLQFKYIKQEDGHKYTIKTTDERYIQASDLSDFKLSSDDVTAYEIISEDNNELIGKLDSLNNNLEEMEKTTDSTGNGEEKAELDKEVEKAVVEEEKQEEKAEETESEKGQKEDEEEKQEDKGKNGTHLTNPLVDGELPKLDESSIMSKNDKFVDTLNNPAIIDIKEEEQVPQIDMSEISRMLYDEEPVLEDQDVMVR